MSEISMVHLGIYAYYLREKDPQLDSRAVIVLLAIVGPRPMKVDGHYLEFYDTYPVLMNLDGIRIYTKTHVTNASNQVGRIYIGRE